MAGVAFVAVGATAVPRAGLSRAIRVRTLVTYKPGRAIAVVAVIFVHTLAVPGAGLACAVRVLTVSARKAGIAIALVAAAPRRSSFDSQGVARAEDRFGIGTVGAGSSGGASRLDSKSRTFRGDGCGAIFAGSYEHAHRLETVMASR